MRTVIRVFVVYCFSCAYLVGAASATLTSTGIGSFSGATVVDFNSIGNEVQISNQYSRSGVTFSGALYGSSNNGDPSFFLANGGGVVASNWLYSVSRGAGLSFEADFSSLVNTVGFYLENWPNQTVVVDIFNGLTDLGSIAFTTSSLTAEFEGLQSTSPFDRLVFTDTNNTNGFYAIDNFQYVAGGNAAPVPEPSTVFLLGAGLAGLGLARRKVVNSNEVLKACQ